MCEMTVAEDLDRRSRDDRTDLETEPARVVAGPRYQAFIKTVG